MPPPQLSWVKDVTDDSLIVAVNSDLYSREALFRVCYLFTDRCYLFLVQDENSPVIQVRFTRKGPDTDLNELAGEFSNELINQKVRLDIAAETKAIRELIVAQAFAEADLFGVGDSEASYLDDPKGIAR
jgi:His-Xaa-Ser system protein HxsD